MLFWTAEESNRPDHCLSDLYLTTSDSLFFLAAGFSCCQANFKTHWPRQQSIGTTPRAPGCQGRTAAPVSWPVLCSEPSGNRRVLDDVLRVLHFGADAGFGLLERQGKRFHGFSSNFLMVPLLAATQHQESGQPSLSPRYHRMPK